MRKICVVTSTRAEYGIMSRLIEKIYQDKDLELQLIATGMHLSEKFGHTIDEITQPITKTVDIEIEKSPAHALAQAIKKFSKIFKQLKPDIVVLLGDRYEIMGVAQSAMLNNIPIAHIHGGETTEGAIDEAIRHSITKMSHLHFTSCEEYRKRVIQLGENPQNVFNVGSLGVENIKTVPLMSKEELEKSLDFKFNNHNLLVTFHPVTLEGNSKEQFEELLKALDELEKTNIIITSPNSDEGNIDIFNLIKDFENTHNNVKTYKSLGMKKYLSTIQFVDAVVGNSSSGILEVPSFGIATVNIGNRQKGRIQAKSIINCKSEKSDILNAIKKAFTEDFTNTKNPYEKDDTANNILKILKDFNINLQKKFYDI
ncbi:UDP-N-acetylglucosamine 2-epimerase (hydrolyzing) [bacterium]|nr:UDP-N-acetylglucosamine 2-epimerase (hydrolyzing) [bacterium]